MKKINLFTYIVFFGFVLFYWLMKNSGTDIDTGNYLMIMVIVLFLLYIIKVILRFKRISNSQDPYERTYDNEEAERTEIPKEVSASNPLEEKKATDKKILVKRGIFIIIAMIGIFGIRHASRVFIADMLLDGFDSTEELFAEMDRKREFRATWEEYRKEEMANGGPTYLVEDIFATTLRPDHWDDFLVLTDLPEDFYYKDRVIQSSDPGDWTITEIFYDYGTNIEFIYFVQSADYDYNKGHLPHDIKKEEGTFYKEEKGVRNQIIWFYDDITLYLEGNISMDELEKVAQSAVNYNTLNYDYSAIEEVAGQYE